MRALRESVSQPEVFCFPGSEAIHEIEGAGIVEAHDLDSLISWMMMTSIDLCIAGEESYLVTGEGLANRCEEAGIPCWGPPVCSGADGSVERVRERIHAAARNSDWCGFGLCGRRGS
ncbi:hypothetical protein N8491_02800 [Akkermansiaceae bacterium]|nr:hypothetical protein [Akkermansiaceae bacterium]